MKQSKHILNGSKRVKTSDFKLYMKNDDVWVFDNELPENIKNILNTYVKRKNVQFLVDENIQRFLKGYIDIDGHLAGARVKHLPSGKPLARGGFSIFAKNLQLNEDGKFEWDICYENDSGLRTYLYSCDKIELEKERKAKIVDEFIKMYPVIKTRLIEDLKRTQQIKYLALYTLLMTFIRVGNLEYYNHYKHKGLTTLKKSDVSVKNDVVVFDFIGKDGIPQHIEKKFEDWYVKILAKRLSKIKDNDFVFADSRGLPIHSIIFTRILFQYTKEHFYPHIIRSYHADTECMKFIKAHKVATKKEVNEKFDKIAQDLGHKKYNKKKGVWEFSRKVTIDNYIRPRLTEEMMNLYK